MNKLIFIIFFSIILSPVFSLNYEDLGEKNYIKYVLNSEETIIYAYSSKSSPELIVKLFSLINDEEYDIKTYKDTTNVSFVEDFSENYEEYEDIAFFEFEDLAFFNKTYYCESLNNSIVYSLNYNAIKPYESYFYLMNNYNSFNEALCKGEFLTGRKINNYEVIFSEIDYGNYEFYNIIPKFGSSFFDLTELDFIKEFSSLLGIEIAQYYNDESYYYFSKKSHNLLVISSENEIEENDSAFEYFNQDMGDGYGFKSLTEEDEGIFKYLSLGSIILVASRFIFKLFRKKEN